MTSNSNTDQACRELVKFTRTTVPFSDDALAKQFVSLHANRYRFDHSQRRWFRWTGSHWRADETCVVRNDIRRTCAQAASTADTPSNGRRLASAKTVAAVEALVQADPAFAIGSGVWDIDPFLLGTPSVTIDLKTGTARASRPTDHISRVTAVSPSQEDCPVWRRFIHEACNSDLDQVRFVQKMAGYALTGDTREQSLFFIFGPGGNGKSVFINVLTGILGDYAVIAPIDTFTAAHGERHPTDLAMLAGARFVSASETEEGRAWAEARIKSLTGGDQITARFMRSDFFTFRPTFKLMIVGNHRPVLKNVDEAARRRIKMVPFVHKPASKDRQLEEKLRLEWPAILSWMIEGCKMWTAEGLHSSTSVVRATEAYFDDQDIVGQWLDERCDVATHHKEEAGVAFADWTSFARQAGEPEGSRKAFTMALQLRGIAAGRAYFGGRQPKRTYTGLRLKFSSGMTHDAS